MNQCVFVRWFCRVSARVPDIRPLPMRSALKILALSRLRYSQRAVRTLCVPLDRQGNTMALR